VGVEFMQHGHLSVVNVKDSFRVAVGRLVEVKETVLLQDAIPQVPIEIDGAFA
jgi:hypothetical protein